MMQGHEQSPKVSLGTEVDHQTAYIINPHAGWVKSSYNTHNTLLAGQHQIHVTCYLVDSVQIH